MNLRTITAAVAGALFATMAYAGVAPHADAAPCTAAHVSSLQGGLDYGQGFRASLVAQGKSVAAVDRDLAATQAALDACTA